MSVVFGADVVFTPFTKKAALDMVPVGFVNGASVAPLGTAVVPFVVVAFAVAVVEIEPAVVAGGADVVLVVTFPLRAALDMIVVFVNGASVALDETVVGLPVGGCVAGNAVVLVEFEVVVGSAVDALF